MAEVDPAADQSHRRRYGLIGLSRAARKTSHDPNELALDERRSRAPVRVNDPRRDWTLWPVMAGAIAGMPTLSDAGRMGRWEARHLCGLLGRQHPWVWSP